jgi:hypothetical protein
MREVHWRKIYVKKMLKGTSKVKTDGAMGRCRELHNEKYRKLYCSPDIIRMIKPMWNWTGRTFSTHGKKKTVNKLMVIKLGVRRKETARKI